MRTYITVADGGTILKEDGAVWLIVPDVTGFTEESGPRHLWIKWLIDSNICLD